MSTATTASAQAVDHGLPTQERKAPGSDRVFDFICLGVLLIFAAAWLAPTLWAVDTSLKNNGVTALGAAEVLSDTSWTFQSYRDVIA